jgi:hypothetical protein
VMPRKGKDDTKRCPGAEFIVDNEDIQRLRR